MGERVPLVDGMLTEDIEPGKPVRIRDVHAECPWFK